MSTIPAPKARPAAARFALLLGLLLIGIGVVGVHDLAVARGWASGKTWAGAVADALDGRTADGVAVAAGVIAILVGLAVVVVALKPARRTHDRALVESDVWITSSALSAVAAKAAEDTPGVAEASARTRRSRVLVTVASDRPEAPAAVEANVRTAFEGLTTKDVTVRTEKISYDS